MYEQMDGQIPDYIAVPTSACGHIRGIHKGYRELREAGATGAIPRMIVVQARNNSPIVNAIKQGLDRVIPVLEVRTIAEAITSGDPPGGDEIIAKAKRHRWLAEDVTEEEILEGQRVLAGSGYFVEPAAAVSLPAVTRLRNSGAIEADATVVIMLTGCGFKDMEVMRHHAGNVIETDIKHVGEDVKKILDF
jgi:threonine synthase